MGTSSYTYWLFMKTKKMTMAGRDKRSPFRLASCSLGIIHTIWFKNSFAKVLFPEPMNSTNERMSLACELKLICRQVDLPTDTDRTQVGTQVELKREPMVGHTVANSL